MRPETICRPVIEMLEAIDDFNDIDAKHRTIVDVEPRPRFILDPDERVPERAVVVNGVDGPEQVEVPILADGTLPDLIPALRSIGDEPRLCITDSLMAGVPFDQPGREFGIGLLPQFKLRPGTHTLAELEEGGKQGRKFFRDMVPGLVSVFVPKLDPFAVSHPLDDDRYLPTVTAWRGEESLGEVAMERFQRSQLLALDTLKDMGADRIEIAGEYRLYPLPDAKTIRKHMGEN